MTGLSKHTPKQMEIEFGEQLRGVGTPMDALDETHSHQFESKQSMNERLACQDACIFEQSLEFSFKVD